MSWVLLIIILFTTIRVYPKWVGYYHILTKGINTTPFAVARDFTWTPKISFMIPSFNEGDAVCHTIDSIMASDYPKDKIEILLVDDCSLDNTWDFIQQLAAKYPDNVVAWKNPENKGKPFTLVDCCRAATGEIVSTVDSDTIISSNSIRELVSCYADPDVGGVGGIVRLKNQNASLWTRMMALQFGIFFYSTKVFENQFLTARVLCGPIASFRREIFLECIPLILSREFLGVTPIRYGEDAYVTTRITLGLGIKKRWKVYTNFNAVAWTDNPETFDTYLKQQLRWWRSQSVGVLVLANFYSTIMKAGVVPALIGCMNTISNMMVILLMLFAYLSGTLVQTCVLGLFAASIFGITSCVGYNYLVGRHDQVCGMIKNPFITGIWFGIYNLVCWCALSIISYGTMDDGGWVTRQNGTQNRR
jgi:hyaluronan synthase